MDDKKLPTEDEQLLESPPPQRPEQLFLKSDSWRVLRIMGEFVWGFDNLADVSRRRHDLRLGAHAGRPTRTT